MDEGVASMNKGEVAIGIKGCEVSTSIHMGKKVRPNANFKLSFMKGKKSNYGLNQHLEDPTKTDHVHCLLVHGRHNSFVLVEQIVSPIKDQYVLAQMEENESANMENLNFCRNEEDPQDGSYVARRYKLATSQEVLVRIIQKEKGSTNLNIGRGRVILGSDAYFDSCLEDGVMLG